MQSEERTQVQFQLERLLKAINKLMTFHGQFSRQEEQTCG